MIRTLVEGWRMLRTTMQVMRTSAALKKEARAMLELPVYRAGVAIQHADAQRVLPATQAMIDFEALTRACNILVR